jgi:hypothetical protein
MNHIALKEQRKGFPNRFLAEKRGKWNPRALPLARMREGAKICLTSHEGSKSSSAAKGGSMRSLLKKRLFSCSCRLLSTFSLLVLVSHFLAPQYGVLADSTPNSFALPLGNELITTDPPILGEPEFIFPSPTCRADIKQFDAGVGQLGMLGDLQSLLTVFKQSSSSDDLQLRKYLQERLVEVVGTDQNAALAVVESVETAQGAESIEQLEALENAPAARTPQVAERLLIMAEQDVDPRRRVLALKALQGQPSLTETQLDRLTALGKDKARPETARASVITIGRVMEKDFTHFEHYVERLLDIAESQNDDDISALAVEMSGMHSDPPFGDVSRNRLANILLSHPSAGVRSVAALVIATARDTEAVLKVYQQAFQESNDFCLRWHIFKFSFRAAGAKALPLAETLAQQDSRFLQHYADFKALYDSGIVDWEHIWLGKISQGELPCDGPSD